MARDSGLNHVLLINLALLYERGYFFLGRFPQFAVCRLPFAVCRLPFAVCRLPLAVCRLPIYVCRLQLAACRLCVQSINPHENQCVCLCVFVCINVFQKRLAKLK